MRLRDGVIAAETEYGTALLDMDSGKYWNLNPTGALVLRGLLEGATTAEIAGSLTEEYPVPAEEAERDVRELQEELAAAGLLIEREPSGRRRSS
ncbi:lasso peptide biosynthesis PqqD family chaperone [Thermoactinospora rubra]|uniref:lasso peptide biosynthesis PqqD family chaperone n=1 Tax=Thermoactinospora rubra TaxID=1088767 RepID=UPI000A10CF72|nr:lasso peptide biosynthesis PqqD family chaperone [Thermoactinospora rubra]